MDLCGVISCAARSPPHKRVPARCLFPACAYLLMERTTGKAHERMTIFDLNNLEHRERLKNLILGAVDRLRTENREDLPSRRHRDRTEADALKREIDQARETREDTRNPEGWSVDSNSNGMACSLPLQGWRKWWTPTRSWRTWGAAQQNPEKVRLD